MGDWWRDTLRLFGNDEAAAQRAERAALDRVTAVPLVDPRFHAEMAQLAARPREAITLGAAAADPRVTVRVPTTEAGIGGHTVVLGGSGTGKTMLALALARERLRRFARDPDSEGFYAHDHKAEFVPLLCEVIGELADELPKAEARRLLDRLVVINPFSTEALVPFQILKPEPGVAPELQAFEATTLVNRLGGAACGVNQDDFLYKGLLACVTLDISMPEFARLLDRPAEFCALAAQCPSAEARSYFAEGVRVTAAALQGVRARIDRLLRLPATRQMLGAKDALPLRKLMSTHVVLVNDGAPPLGCEDIGAFWRGLLALKFTRAIFERAPEEAARPVAAFVDEWQEGLAAGGDIADHYERVLSMARSRGVFLTLLSQSLAGAARVSASLPKIVATNTNTQILFRASIEDARAMAHMLPVTGRAPRPAGLPWEGRARSPYLTQQEELQARIEEAASLPDRMFYLWNRRRPYRAVLARSVDVTIRRPAMRTADLAWRLRNGALAVPVDELRATEPQPPEGTFRVASPDEADPPAVAAWPSRRPRRGGPRGP